MFNIIKHGTKFDFIGKAPVFGAISLATFVIGVGVLAIKGINPGLDFSGGHEILLAFDAQKNVTAEQTRAKLSALFSDVDATVQRYEVPTSTSTFYLTRIERSESFGKAEISAMESGFRAKYGESFSRLRYNPESGDVIEVEFAANATTALGRAIATSELEEVVKPTGHDVRHVRPIGRNDRPRYSIVFKGIDTLVLKAMRELDPSARTVRVEFVGPTVGKQLRDDGLLAVLYALVMILVYVAFRFDFFYSPGAIICLFHDAVITVAALALFGQEFTLTTIAGVLTLIGYSINDTIIVFDRIRETIGKTQGSGLKDVVNRAINETLGRTIMTSSTTLFACICLMAFGRGTVLASFGTIMFMGVIFGTYSSIFVASPIFIYLRNRFGPKMATAKAGHAIDKGRAAAGA